MAGCCRSSDGRHAAGTGVEVLSRLFAAIDRIVIGCIVVIFAAMVVAGLAQIFNRYVLNTSLSWSEEFQRFCHIWIVFLTIPVVYQRGGHIGIDYLVTALPALPRKAAIALINGAWLVLGGAIAWTTWSLMAVASRQTSPGLGLRMDWVYAGLLIGGAYLALVAARQTVAGLRAVDGACGDRPPDQSAPEVKD